MPTNLHPFKVCNRPIQVPSVILQAVYGELDIQSSSLAYLQDQATLRLSLLSDTTAEKRRK
jgi:hypothetical protein